MRMRGCDFVDDLRIKFRSEHEIGGDDAVADRLGVSRQTLRNWSRSKKQLEAFQVSNALIKAQTKAVQTAQYETIQPIVEFYPIDCSDSKREAGWEVLPQSGDGTSVQRGLGSELQARRGLYIFYDSRGRALYVGKARKQTLWKEMNLAYNRARGEVQSIMLVGHPERNQTFAPAYSKPRQPRDCSLRLHDLAEYFSAYWVIDAMIEDLEALLVRGFANDLLNVRMETFSHTRKAPR